MEQTELGKFWPKRKRELQFTTNPDNNVKHNRPTGPSLSGTSPYFKPEIGEGSDVYPTTVPSYTAEKEAVCPPLPKSRFLSSVMEEPDAQLKTSESRSGSEFNNVDTLPPPNMDYLTRKPLIPLKWSRTNTCSGFVLEDNTVMFIGTRKCEEAIRQSFLHYLRGGEGDLDDYLESVRAGNSNALKEECNSEIVTDEIQSAFLMKKNKERLLSDSELPSLPSGEANETCKLNPVGADSATRKTSYSNASSSSDEDDLPRVQVTGRSVPAETSSNYAWKTSSRTELQSEPGNPGARKTMSSSCSSESISCEGSSEHPLLKCPICNVSLPSSYTEFDTDEHIAMCLSTNINDFENDRLSF